MVKAVADTVRAMFPSFMKEMDPLAMVIVALVGVHVLVFLFWFISMLAEGKSSKKKKVDAKKNN